jgi:hypothetical protein
LEKEQESMMRSHWVDTATQTDLDSIGFILESKRISDEEDNLFRARLKRTVIEYMGGGTIPAILEALRALILAQDPNDVQIIENPPETMLIERKVLSGDSWEMSSSSISNTMPRITLTVEEAGEVSSPIITDLGSNKGISYNGDLKGGQRLVFTQDRAELDGVDVTNKASVKEFPQLVRAGSKWQYTESLSKMLGVFDGAKFDESTFTKGIPYVKLSFEWTSYLPATFEVQIQSDALDRSGFDVKDIEGFVNTKKAAGVKSIIKIIKR